MTPAIARGSLWRAAVPGARHDRMTGSRLLVGTCVLVFALSGQAGGDQHPYSLDDHLQLEDTGAAAIDPTGRWLVYERMPAYERRPDFSVGRIATWDSGGGYLMVVDLSLQSPRAKPLFEPDPQTTYWIDGFSPDGKYLAFYSSVAGRVSLGVHSFATGGVATFEPPPRIDWISGHTAVWTADGQAIYSAVAEGDQPAALSLRRHTAARFNEEWQKAWEGKKPSVSIVKSHAQGIGGALDGRLVIIDPKSRRHTILGQGVYEDLQLSPDGRYLAAVRTERQAQPEPQQLQQDWIVARSVLHVWDLVKRSAAKTPYPKSNVFPGSIVWSPDSARLAVFGWNERDGVRTGRFLAVDIASGRTYSYPHHGLDLASERERGYLQRPERAVWMGERLAVVARKANNPSAPPSFTYRDLDSRSTRPLTKADWFLLTPDGRSTNLTARFETVSPIPVSAFDDALFVLADGRVWRVAPSREPHLATPRVEGRLVQPSWIVDTTKRLPFTRWAIFESQTTSTTPAYVLVDLSNGTAWLSPFSRDPSLLTASAAAGALLFREDSESGSKLQLVRKAAPPTVIDTLNAHLRDVAKPTWTTLKYTLSSGREVEGCVLLPADYKPDVRYPAVVEVYPGRVDSRQGPMCLNPAAQHLYGLGRKPGAYSLQLLAGHGYVVMMPATPLDAIRTPEGPIAGITDTVQSGVDALIAHGYASPDRIGLFGMSQGAFAALWIATQTQQFGAVVSMNGWSNMLSHYFQGASAFTRFYADDFPYVGDALRYESIAGSDYGLGKTPWDDPQMYLRNSPVLFAPRIDTAVMLIHSDMDAFPLTQFDEMFTALYRQRKEAEFVRYWGEGHGPSSPANIRDMWERIFAWYDRHLAVE